MDQYRIVSRVDLPDRLKGTFNFAEAYRLSCEWNQKHAAEDLAEPEKVEVEIPGITTKLGFNFYDLR